MIGAVLAASLARRQEGMSVWFIDLASAISAGINLTTEVRFLTVYRGYIFRYFFLMMAIELRGNAICSGGGRMAQARRKILCIEDDRETAALIAEELVDHGFDVSTAYSGQEGLLAIMKATPDLVLCDVSMPTMSGFEVLARLNEFAPRLGRIPFVFLTALADRDNELKGRRLGADDYVTKPIDFERLVFIINARLAGVARTKLLPKLPKLNDREIEVLTLVARGKTSAEIARKLRLSKRTVDFHIDNARIKLHAATRTEAVVKAAHDGLI